MSSLTKVLAEEVRKIEETAAVGRAMQTNRLTHHRMAQRSKRIMLV